MVAVSNTIVRTLALRGYRLDGPPFTVGRPDRATVPVVSAGGEPLVAKLYPGGGHEAFAASTSLWASSFGARRIPPGLPRPVEHLAESGVVIMERVEGRPMAELGADRHLGGAIDLLVDLHRSDARLASTRSANGVLRSIARKASDARALAPGIGARFDSLLGRLEANRPHGGPLVPSHGDFSARNVLVGDDRLVLIDWDRARVADPAQDVAYMGVWSWACALRTGGEPRWDVLSRAVATYQRLRPEAEVGRRVPFYAAAGLARVAHSLLLLWPGDSHHVPALLDEAEHLLG